MSRHVECIVRPDIAKGELAAGATAHGPAAIVCLGPSNGTNAYGVVVLMTYFNFVKLQSTLSRLNSFGNRS